ncbi:MAG: hypothetical protein PVJ67_03355 [Candidatus Pacearchaeota archaeon]|jgi:DNA-directed RNA polymerase subunit F
MTIEEKQVLSMSEASEYLDKDTNSDLIGFIKKFKVMKTKDAKELRKKLAGLDLMKMNDKHIAKLIDNLPSDKDELNKIFTDVGLDEDETNKILSAIKEFS